MASSVLQWREEDIMRKPLRTRLGLGLALSAAIGAWLAACGGSDTQDVIESPDTGPPETSTVDNFRPDTGPPDTGKPDTGPVYDAGPPNVLDGGDLYEGGVPCVVGGLLEEEPNDDRDAANVVDPTRCGAILLTASSDPDGGAGDAAAELDYLTFTLKPATKSFYIQFQGDVILTVDVEGKPTTTITKTSSPPVPFVRDKPYFIQIKSETGKRANWRVTIFES
jgi:hypothetical protein